MKTNAASTDTASSTFLTGAILFANLDYSGLGGYAIKAAIGGAIWMIFKLAGDYLAQKLLDQKSKSKDEEENHISQRED